MGHNGLSLKKEGLFYYFIIILKIFFIFSNFRRIFYPYVRIILVAVIEYSFSHFNINIIELMGE